MVISPDPEQRVYGGILPCRRRGEPAEFPGELDKGEISAAMKENINRNNKKNSQNGENKMGENGVEVTFRVSCSVTYRREQGNEEARKFFKTLILLTKI